MVFAQVACFLDDCEFQDYIDETGWWDKRIELLEPRKSIRATDNADATLASPAALKDSMEVGRHEPSANSRFTMKEQYRCWWECTRCPLLVPVVFTFTQRDALKRLVDRQFWAKTTQTPSIARTLRDP